MRRRQTIIKHESTMAPSSKDDFFTGATKGALWLTFLASIAILGLLIANLVITVDIDEDVDKQCGLLGLQADSFNDIIANCTGITLSAQAQKKGRASSRVGSTELGAESTFSCQQICVNLVCTCPIPVDGAQSASCCARQRACCVWNCATQESGCPWS